MENMKIGHKIQEYRRIHNITIKEFAEIKKMAFELNVTNLNEETKEKLATNDNNDSNENYDKHEFYGGISFRNDSVYMTDDDDFLDEFSDDILLKQHP